MANNFQITLDRKMNNIRLKLRGDFDGMSAMMLICAIKDNYSSAQKIYIETDGLNSLLPFGQDVFRKKLSLPPASLSKLVFMGDHGSTIAPEGINSIN
jgi:hypothetical protein